MQYCPKCGRPLRWKEKCASCGFEPSQYHETERSLPMGSRLDNCLIGVLLTTNRQAQFYAAIEADTERRIIVEEFLPYVTMGRVSGHEETSVVKHPESVAEAKRLFLNSRQQRCLPLLRTMERNGTVYRIYDAGEENLSEKAEQLADDPILFRDGVGRPLMSITGIPFPAMPETREYRGAGAEEKKRKNESNPWKIVITIAGALILMAGTWAVTKTVNHLPLFSFAGNGQKDISTDNNEIIETSLPVEETKVAHDVVAADTHSDRQNERESQSTENAGSNEAPTFTEELKKPETIETPEPQATQQIDGQLEGTGNTESTEIPKAAEEKKQPESDETIEPQATQHIEEKPESTEEAGSTETPTVAVETKDPEDTAVSETQTGSPETGSEKVTKEPESDGETLTEEQFKDIQAVIKNTEIVFDGFKNQQKNASDWAEQIVITMKTGLQAEPTLDQTIEENTENNPTVTSESDAKATPEGTTEVPDPSATPELSPKTETDAGSEEMTPAASADISKETPVPVSGENAAETLDKQPTEKPGAASTVIDGENAVGTNDQQPNETPSVSPKTTPEAEIEPEVMEAKDTQPPETPKPKKELADPQWCEPFNGNVLFFKNDFKTDEIKLMTEEEAEKDGAQSRYAIVVGGDPSIYHVELASAFGSDDGFVPIELPETEVVVTLTDPNYIFSNGTQEARLPLRMIFCPETNPNDSPKEDEDWATMRKLVYDAVKAEANEKITDNEAKLTDDKEEFKLAQYLFGEVKKVNEEDDLTFIKFTKADGVPNELSSGSNEFKNLMRYFEASHQELMANGKEARMDEINQYLAIDPVPYILGKIRGEQKRIANEEAMLAESNEGEISEPGEEQGTEMETDESSGEAVPNNENIEETAGSVDGSGQGDAGESNPDVTEETPNANGENAQPDGEQENQQNNPGMEAPEENKNETAKQGSNSEPDVTEAPSKKEPLVENGKGNDWRETTKNKGK